MQVADALKHPYFESLHDPSDEPTTDELFSWDFEETAMRCCLSRLIDCVSIQFVLTYFGGMVLTCIVSSD